MEKDKKKRLDSASKKAIVDCGFSKVISMVEDGYNIYEALAKLGINRAIFYANISKKQKSELQIAKTLNTKFGVGSWCP